MKIKLNLKKYNNKIYPDEELIFHALSEKNKNKLWIKKMEDINLEMFKNY